MADTLTPAERSLRARLAVLTSWENTRDPSARTQPGRDKFDQRFLDQVDPDRTLPEAERLRRVEYARRAYFTGLSLKAAKARRKRAES